MLRIAKMRRANRHSRGWLCGGRSFYGHHVGLLLQLSLMLLMLGTLFCHAQYSVLNGDLNHDGKITVEDITMMTNIVLQKSYSETIEAATELSYGVPLAEMPCC